MIHIQKSCRLMHPMRPMQVEDITNYQEVRDAIAKQLRSLHDTPNR